MSVVDSAMTREVLRDITKRPVDVSNLDVHVTHGVIYLRGRIEKLRGYHEDLDLDNEIHLILKLLRQKPGIRDICCEFNVGPVSLKERLTENLKRTT